MPDHARRLRAALLAPALLFGPAACVDEPTGPEPVSIEETEFAPELGIDLAAMDRTDAGTYYLDVVAGDSTEAAPGDSLLVHYKVWLHDGTLVQDTRDLLEDGGDADPPIWILLSAEDVILGWVDGIPGMRVGGTRKLVIPWQLAYGSRSVLEDGEVIVPPYSNLVFEVELVGLKEPPEQPAP